MGEAAAARGSDASPARSASSSSCAICPSSRGVALEDLRGVERRELLDHRLHEVLLVLGVRDQQLHQVAPAAGDRADRLVVVGVDARRRRA